jgi:hypothetical protein
MAELAKAVLSAGWHPAQISVAAALLVKYTNRAARSFWVTQNAARF